MVTTTLKKSWVYEDLFDLPEGRRHEIIEGELYEMTAPNFDHATAVANLFAFFIPIVRSLGGIVRTAPIDVFMLGADPVQPDLIVLLRQRMHFISRRGIEGPPDLLVEILSPSNPSHDRVTKRRIYERAGVREYWLVDPEAASIEVLVLEGGVYVTLLHAHNDDIVTSSVLPGLSLTTSDVFSI